MLYVIGVLMLANAVTLFWPSAKQSAGPAYVVRQNVKSQFIRLNREIEERFLPDSHLAKPVATDDELLDEESVAPAVCYRLGPFLQTKNYVYAKSLLAQAQISYRESQREAIDSGAFRIYLGPFQTRAEALDSQTELREKQILDHFIQRVKGSSSYIVSLGVYSTLESANKALVLYSDRIPEIQMEQAALRLPMSYWLHVSLNEQSDQYLAITRMDWQNPSVKLGKFRCFE